MVRSSEAGTQRLVAAMAAIRFWAAGERRATHRPPSEPKHFWGAK